MDVVIDGMVVEAEVTMVEACTGLITVGRGEATVVGINMFGLYVSSLGYYCLGNAGRGNVTTVVLLALRSFHNITTSDTEIRRLSG